MIEKLTKLGDIMIEKLTKLVDVKSIVTLLLTAVFSYLCITGKLTSEQFMTIFVMVITYYFAKPQKEETDGRM